MAFYTIFEQLCSERGITPTQVARDNGLTQQTVSHWKTRGSTPKAETVQKLADYFNVSVDYLLGIEKEKAPITEDERQKRLDQICKVADSTYKFLSELGALVGLDRQLSRDIIYKNDLTEQVQKEIKKLFVKFMETATFEEKVNFVLQLREIGRDFTQQVDSLESLSCQRSQLPQEPVQDTPPAREGTDTTPAETPPQRPQEGEE